MTEVIFMLKHSVKITSLHKLGDVAACRRAACVLCAVRSETDDDGQLKIETCRSDIIEYFNVNLNLLTKLINSAVVGECVNCVHFQMHGATI